MYTEEEYKTYQKVKHELLLKDAKHYVLRHFKTDKDENSEYARYALGLFDLEDLTNDFEFAYDDNYEASETWEDLICDRIWHMKHDDDESED